MKIKSLAARHLAFALVGLGTLAALPGCEPKGPAEKAGETLDQAGQNIGDAVNPKGPGEKAGEAVDRTVNP